MPAEHINELLEMRWGSLLLPGEEIEEQVKLFLKSIRRCEVL